MIYDTERGNFTLALTGDTMLSRRLTPFTEDRYLAVRDILRNADVAFTNMEATVRRPHEGVHDLSEGTLMTTPPHLLDDLKWMGIDFVSCANNHAADFGHGGIAATLKHLDRAGLPHSGSGRNLDEARAPAYLDTPAGRVALISANAFFRPWHRAAPQGPDSKGRPGVNLLAYETTYTVDKAAFEQLKRMQEGLGFAQSNARRRRHFFNEKESGGNASEESLTFQGNRYVLGDAFSFTTDADPSDLAANLKWIAEARRQADWVVVSLHCHAMNSRDALTAEDSTQQEEIADFAQAFARQAIDAGADAVAGHGPHISLGVEVYKGKPICHGLGNFIFENDTIETVPLESRERFGLGADATPADFFDARSANDSKSFPAFPEYWRSIFATCRFEGGDLKGFEIHPLDLGYGLSRSQRGRPVLAEDHVSAEILERTARISEFFDTEIDIRDGIGHVVL